MFSFQIMNNYPTAFEPFINFELVQTLMALGVDDAVTQEFSEKYNLSYIGEVGERWHEREGIIADNKDLLALIVAMSSTERKNVMYNQRERFCISSVRHVLAQYDFVTAATLLAYAADTFLTNEHSEIAFFDLLDKVLEDEKSLAVLSTAEMAFVIHHLVAGLRGLYLKNESAEEAYLLVEEKMTGLLVELVDKLIEQGVKLQSYDTTFDDAPIIEMLANVYIALKKPKANTFKTKGVVRYLQSFEALMYKEIDLTRAIGISELLNVKLRNVFVYNHQLVVERNGYDSNNSNITAPGRERIIENFIEYGLFSQDDLEPVYKEKLGLYKNTKKYLGHLFSCINRFKNPSNLEYFVKVLADVIVLNQIGSQHISLIQKGLLTDVQKHKVALELLQGNRYVNELNKEDFYYLYDIIETLNSTDAETYVYPKSTLAFIRHCLDYELFTVTDIEKIQLLKAENEVLKYLHDKEDVIALLEFLNQLDMKYHKFLIEKDIDIKDLLIDKKYSKAIIQRFYEMFVEALFYHKPNKYPSEIYQMQKEDKLFKSTFELTVEEVTAIEKGLFETEMLEKSQTEELYEKYTPDEVKQKNYIEQLKKKLEQCDAYFKMSGFYKDNLEMLYKYEELSELYTNQFIKCWVQDVTRHNIGEYLEVFYLLKITKVLSENQLEMIETRILNTFKNKHQNTIDELATLQQ